MLLWNDRNVGTDKIELKKVQRMVLQFLSYKLQLSVFGRMEQGVVPGKGFHVEFLEL